MLFKDQTQPNQKSCPESSAAEMTDFDPSNQPKPAPTLDVLALPELSTGGTMRPKISQWFESWFFRTDHWIGHDQVASRKLERVAEKAYRAGFERGRHFERCASTIKKSAE